VYVQPDPECPFLAELQGIVVKTVGLVDVVAEALESLTDRIDVAFIYGSIARAEELASSDIDLMVMGAATRFELASPLRETDERLGRPINLSLYKQP